MGINLEDVNDKIKVATNVVNSLADDLLTAENSEKLMSYYNCQVEEATKLKSKIEVALSTAKANVEELLKKAEES